MKKMLSILLLIFCWHVVKAQNIKPYLAVVKTISGNQKGILQKVDSTFVYLSTKTGFIKIGNNEITHIKIREVKKGYNAKRYVSYDWDTSEFNQLQNEKFVNKWGKEEPNLEEQLGASIFGEIFNGIINFIAFPIHLINPSIASYNFKRKSTKEQLVSLNYYSINYQTTPKRLLDLRQFKAVNN